MKNQVNQAGDILNEINKQTDVLAIVEGKRDQAALQRLGFKNIITLDKPLFAVADDIESEGIKQVVILTDLDSEGKRLYSILRKDLNDRGILVDNTLRELLFKTELRHIEGLDTYLQNHSS